MGIQYRIFQRPFIHLFHMNISFLLSIFLSLVLAKLHEHDKLAKVTEEIERMKEAQVN